MLRQVLSIVKYFWQSISDLRSGAVKFILYTGLISLLFVIVMVWGIWQFSAIAAAGMVDLLEWDWARDSTVFSLVVLMALIVMCWMVFKYLLLMVLRPLLSYVSASLEKKLRKSLDSTGYSLVQSTTRSVRVTGRNLLRELIIVPILLLASLLPVLYIPAVVLALLVQAYFMGFGIMDFYLQRHFSFGGTVKEVYRHKWAAVTLGAIFIALLFIPVVGALMAPYFTTAAATRYFIGQEQKV
jgi:CysZ protein